MTRQVGIGLAVAVVVLHAAVEARRGPASSTALADGGRDERRDLRRLVIRLCRTPRSPRRVPATAAPAAGYGRCRRRAGSRPAPRGRWSRVEDDRRRLADEDRSSSPFFIVPLHRSTRIFLDSSEPNGRLCSVRVALAPLKSGAIVLTASRADLQQPRLLDRARVRRQVAQQPEARPQRADLGAEAEIVLRRGVDDVVRWHLPLAEHDPADLGQRAVRSDAARSQVVDAAAEDVQRARSARAC